MANTLLHIDALARLTGSTSRKLSSRIVAHLGPDKVVRRDLAAPLPQIDDAWVTATFTAADQRSTEQNFILALSDQLVDELIAADTVVIGLPIYNFSVPASFKAWIDLAGRSGRTFEYTANGPRGLLYGKRAAIAVFSGGTKIGSELEFASGYVAHIMRFVGITDVEVVAADQLAIDPAAALDAAYRAVTRLAA